MLIYKNNPTLPQGGPDIGLKVGILAEIGNMLHECALVKVVVPVRKMKVYKCVCYTGDFWGQRKLFTK